MSRMMAFVDAENLLIRYEGCLKNGWEPRVGGVTYQQGKLIWSPYSIYQVAQREQLMRVHYYTTFVGSDPDLAALTGQIRNLSAGIARALMFSNGNIGGDLGEQITVIPRIFKKQKSGIKTKSVDINICVDVLEYVHADAVDSIFLVSGDGDYLPLVKAAMRAGKRTYVAALSNGLNSQLVSDVDKFIDLDQIYFIAKP